jgi:excisionase family DNA binding protein
MNKTEAAKFLGVSPRAVERYTTAGRLAATYTRGKTGQVLTFDEDELQRFKDELEAPQPKAIAGTVAIEGDSGRQGATSQLARVVGASSLQRSETATDVMRMLATLAQGATGGGKVRQGATVPIESKLQLSREEAQELANVGPTVLRAAIADGELEAKKIGGAWRIKRTDLDKWIEGL